MPTSISVNQAEAIPAWPKVCLLFRQCVKRVVISWAPERRKRRVVLWNAEHQRSWPASPGGGRYGASLRLTTTILSLPFFSRIFTMRRVLHKRIFKHFVLGVVVSGGGRDARSIGGRFRPHPSPRSPMLMSAQSVLAPFPVNVGLRSSRDRETKPTTSRGPGHVRPDLRCFVRGRRRSLVFPPAFLAPLVCSS